MNATDFSTSVETGSDSRKCLLEYVGIVLTGIVAGIHLFHPGHGLFRFFALVSTDPALLVFDPRPLAFVLSGIALLVGLSLSRNAPSRRPYYVSGILLALLYFVGYFAWHFTGHGGFLPGRAPLFHGLTPTENVVAHLTGDAWAAISKLAELAMAGVLTVLYIKAERSE